MSNATTIRMDDYTKVVIDSAAKYMQQTRSAFILSAVRKEAERVIKERAETMNQILPMILSPMDSKDFLAALEPEYNPLHQLHELKKHYDSIITMA